MAFYCLYDFFNISDLLSDIPIPMVSWLPMDFNCQTFHKSFHNYYLFDKSRLNISNIRLLQRMYADVEQDNSEVNS